MNYTKPIPVFGTPYGKSHYGSVLLFVITIEADSGKYELHKWRVSAFGLSKGHTERYDSLLQARSYMPRGRTRHPAEESEMEFGLVESWI